MNHFKPLISLFTLILMALSLQAQSPGDTIKVESWNYNSTNRDTIISFPSTPGVSYERVIMRYAMRCKDGLVSSGTNRNLGCGEWDYSCNTYVHNPNLADSVQRTISKYQITPSSSDSIFSALQTYRYNPNLQQLVVVDSVISQFSAHIGNGTSTANTQTIRSYARNGKSIIHYTAAELSSAGLTAGNINAMQFFASVATTAKIKHFRIGMRHSAANPFTTIDTSVTSGFQNVYYHEQSFISGANYFHFHTPFNWDGTSDVLIELTYEGDVTNPFLHFDRDSSGSSIIATDDYSLDLFSGNYVEANNYFGIPGTATRTVEAWIKTTSGGEIASWGTDVTGGTGQKLAFRVVNGSGFIRVEVNGGFIVGSTPVDDGQWHHVAFTLSGGSVGNINLWVDGQFETRSAISNVLINTGSTLPFQVSKGFHNRYFNGDIDDIRLWSTVLSPLVMRDWMNKRPDATHPNFNNLELHYPIDSTMSTVHDRSGKNRNGTFHSSNSFNLMDQRDIFKNFTLGNRPQVEFFQGTYATTIINDTIMDTIPLAPFIVEERAIVPRPGSIQTDSISRTTTNVYPQFNQTYDLSGNLIGTSPSAQMDTLGQRTLPYYQRNAQKVEIMSFVTPYGINLDLGIDGEAWYFDVTDFLPVLEGNRRMTMERGGQWQEDMDLDFYFIVGTPPAPVKSIREVWQVNSRSYTSINNNTYFAPRAVDLDTSASRYKIRSAITGHGQQGEFIPRTHTVSVNNTQFPRSVWKECAENPVYPQGGTWIYDRAGWCPGMATDVAEYDITNLVSGGSATIDYDVSNASGTSNYIVSTQLVEYGSPSFTNDARIENVLRPNNQTEFGRRNPSCFNPVVILKNTGSNLLTSATIEVSINGSTPFSHNWTGSLAFMDETNVAIPVPAGFWSAANQSANTFKAEITGVNNGSDQYSHNNEYNTDFVAIDTLPNQFRLILKTNNAANQNSISIVNSAGTLVYSRNNFPNNTTSGSNINLGPGCYQLRLNDTNDDGLSFFANNAGTGFFRIEDMNFGILQSFNPDFGDRIEYYFTIVTSTALEEESETRFEMYPNPTNDFINIHFAVDQYNWVLRDAMGKVVKSGNVVGKSNWEQIDLNDLAKGIYFINIDHDEEIIIRKVVKQ